MTVEPFGQVTPIQIEMLLLIGYRFIERSVTLVIPDEERKANMMGAREALQEATGADFGYDLLAWHRFLIEHEEFNYTDPYAYKNVARVVEETLNDSKRAQLVLQIEAYERSLDETQVRKDSQEHD